MTIGSALTGSYQHSPTRLARLSCVLLTQQDIYHFREGTYVRAYQKLGAHAVRAADGTVGGTRFAVWAPNAAGVAVIGDFNGWDRRTSPLAPRGDSSRSEEHTSELQSPDTISYAVFCLKKKKKPKNLTQTVYCLYNNKTRLLSCLS